jgi:hypothetical protein
LRAQAPARERVLRARRHVDDARRGRRAGDRDCAQPRMGMEAAHECHVQQSRQLEVADEAAAPGDETPVLASRLAHAEWSAHHVPR